jgi:hypothetical protein
VRPVRRRLPDRQRAEDDVKRASKKPLALARETLRNLDTAALAPVVGGATPASVRGVCTVNGCSGGCNVSNDCGSRPQ